MVGVRGRVSRVKSAIALGIIVVAVVVPGYLVGSPTPAQAGSSPSVSLSWQPNPPIHLDNMTFDTVSCEGLNFCMAGGQGEAVVSGSINQSTGSISFTPMSPLPPFPNISSLSCDGLAGECMAVTYSGNAELYNGSTSTWTPYANFDSVKYVTSVSCAGSPIFCAAVDSAGNEFTYTSGAWSSASVSGSTALGTVSCVSSVLCMAGGTGGYVYEYNGSGWAAPSGITNPADTSGAAITAISCPSTAFCMAADASGNAVPLGYNSAWTAGSPTSFASASVSSISCPALGLCVAVDASGKVYTYDSTLATAWSTNTVSGSPVTGLSSVQCVSVFACVAVGGGSYVFYGGTWATTTVASGISLYSISCVSSSFCMAGGAGGDIYEYNGSSWATPSGLTNPVDTSAGTIYGISCPTSSFCMGVDSNGYYIALSYSGSSWAGAPVNFDSTNQVNSVSCVSISFCMAVDSIGNAFVYNGSSWAAPSGLANPINSSVDSGSSLESVSCVSATSCDVVDSSDYGWYYSGSSWTHSSLTLDSGASTIAVSCTPSNFCEAADTVSPSQGDGINFAANFSSTAGTPFMIGGGSSLGQDAISCPASGVCVSVGLGGSGGYLPDTTGGTWNSSGMVSIESGTSNNLTAISCPSISFCTAVDSGGNAIGISAKWSSSSFPNIARPFESVSCPTSIFCMAVDESGNYATYNYASGTFGNPWSALAPISTLQAGILVASVSCVSTTFCVAVDANGDALTYSGSTWSSPTSIETTDSLVSVSCISTISCFALDSNGSAYLDSSGSWTSQGATGITGTGASNSLSCASSSSLSRCVAVGLNGQVGYYNGSTWGLVSGLDGTNNLTSVSCPSTSQCNATDYAGNVLEMVVSSSLTGTVVSVSSGVPLTSISCPAASPVVCMAVSMAGQSYLGSTTSWTNYPVNSMPIASVSCPLSNFCAEADTAGNVAIGASSVGSVSAALSPDASSGASSETLTAGFTTSSVGGLGAGSQIMISAAQGTPGLVMPYGTLTDFSIACTSVTASCTGGPVAPSSVTSPDNGATVYLTLPTSGIIIGSSSSVTVTITGVTVSTSPGGHFLDVSTSQDVTQVQSASFNLYSGVSISSFSPSNTGALEPSNYSLSFIPTTALVGGTDTITLNAYGSATGTIFPTAASNYSIAQSPITPASTVSSVNVTNSGQTVTMVIPFSASTSYPVTVTINSVTNPPSGTGYYLTVATSKDLAAIPTPTYATVPAVSNVSVSLTPNETSAPASYTIGFTTSSSGALTSGTSTITLSSQSGSSGTGWPTLASDYAVNGTVPSSVTVNTATFSVTITVSANIAASTPVTLTVSSVTNPSTTGSNDYLDVSTSSDTSPVESNYYPISGSPSQVEILFTGSTITASSIATTSMGIQLADSAGIPADALAATVVNLGATPAGSGTNFSLTSGGSVINAVTIPSGSNSATIFFGDTQAGSVSISASSSGLSSTPLVVTITSLTPPPTQPTTTISLSSSAASAKPGTSVIITATVESISATTSTASPANGASVSFDVSSGPDQGKTYSATTNSSGTASFTLTNSGVSGVDSITGGTVDPSTGQIIVASTSVDFSGQPQLTLTPASQGSITNETVTVSASALDAAGNPLVGVSITFSVTSGPDLGQSLSAISSSAGTATFSLSATKQGVDTVSASMIPPGMTTAISATPVQVKWAAPIVITPSGGNGGGSSSNPLPPGSKALLSLTLTSRASSLLRTLPKNDQLITLAKLLGVSHSKAFKKELAINSVIAHTSYVPDVGVPVDFSVSSGPNSGISATVPTDSTGTASFSYSDSGGPGTDTVLASFVDTAGLSHSTTFTVIWGALATTTTTTSITTSTTFASTTTLPISSTTIGVSATTSAPASSYSSPPISSYTPPPSSYSGSPTSTSSPSSGSSTTFANAPTTTTPKSASGKGGRNSATSKRLSGSSVKGTSRQALGVIGTASSISNGNTVTRSQVKALVKAGHLGPDMGYNRGYGLGRNGGPPGQVPLAQSIPSPTEVFHSFSAKLLSGNGLLVFVIMFLIGLPAMIFNSILKDHHDKLASSAGSIRKAMDRLEGWMNNLHGSVVLMIFAAIGGLLYALDDQNFGLNLSSLAEILGFAGAIIISTSATEVARGVYVHRRFSKIGDLKAYPLGLIMALGFDIFSRISHFEPGYVFGILAAVVFRARLTQHEDGKSITLSYIWLFGVAIVSWIVWIPVKDAVIGGNHNFGVLVLDALLSSVWVCGLQSLFFGLIPIRTMDGGVVMKWSKPLWTVMFVLTTFIFVQFIIHPSAAGYGGNSHTSLVPLIAIFIVTAVASGVFYIFVKLKWGKMTQDSSTPPLDVVQQ